ncbi:hypothetical protein L6164_012489 [Bauhinia variegata]|uniref:Uncharacterized protein n=1 Tax=Bauhinia variegata TaxID=167791 RepID=A0ACB9PA90_BAUVA|nr:hypothetical protein L6164_012489 [Bauhinia variegata]
MKALQALSKPTSQFPAKAVAASSYPHAPSKQTSESHFISLIHTSKKVRHLREIHAQILKHNLFSSSRVATQFISCSSSLKSIDYGVSIFGHIREKNSFVFNALIRGLCENAQFEGAISFFTHMLRLNVKPDGLTYPFVLKSAAALLMGELGSSIHGGILKFGLEFDSFVRVSLVDMYVKVDKIGYALQVFDDTPERIKHGSILLCNVCINGCCKVGDLTKATELFEAMPKRNIASWNTLINGFVRNGDMNGARELFNHMPEKNVVSWTTLVSGFSQNGDHREALSILTKMIQENVRPNDLTVVSALSACAKLGALDAGVRIYNYLSSRGFVITTPLGNALVDMYAKCGNIEAASKVFADMKQKDLLTWSIMLWGWAIHGHHDRALQCFKQMKSAGIKPDAVVFLSILTACSHTGKVDEGLHFFNSMKYEEGNCSCGDFW